MKQAPSVEKARSRRERIREMGFDPRHLTIEEQEELLELDWRLEAPSAPELSATSARPQFR